MHPGLPCFYQKKDDDTKQELLRGATVKLDNNDLFSLHSNPDCQFRVIQSTSGDSNGDVGSPPADEAKTESEAKAKPDVKGRTVMMLCCCHRGKMQATMAVWMKFRIVREMTSH